MMNGGGGGRVPTWRERENNRRRERRRRAIAAKIYAGLRAYGNYTLPKHCDNNEVLKALCNEAGWTVEPDGTTYRKYWSLDRIEAAHVKKGLVKEAIMETKGCKPPASELADQLGRSPSASPCSSYQPSPRGTSSFPSSGSSSQITLGGGGGGEGSSLIPWLKTLSSAGVGIGGGSSSKFPAHYSYFGGGSISAPVTPPSGSPPRTPRLKTAAWEEYHHHHAGSVLPPWATVGASYAYAASSSLPNSTPPSPRRKVAAAAAAAGGGNDAAAWLAGFQISSAGPSSPTYSLVAPPPNPFGAAAAAAGSSSRVMSGACSPVAGGDVQMADAARREFAFGGEGGKMTGLVKAWEGERIHEECGSDDLELTLGSSMTRGDR
ncbi:Os02g0233200 [Oryza sativa Japonica Group]|uniref:Protein BZR1 homolog n=2 Tax=Oryza TaxID=4527 RepID=A0A0E0NC58_ORYRU|nr:putative mature anther-specific protein LAT61 [Oryza sativa Japonica Group]BAH91598.1 Os02g0233200 [Oryza sativa Japonica Group]|eukprot:NP_001172869.1 Os02g0233200 [Oryza sativa Japonica Group]